MPNRCPSCGNIVMNDERFCTRCGHNMYNDSNKEAVDVFSESTSYSQPNYYNQQTYVSHQKPVDNSEMTFGKWVLTVFVTTCLSIVSIVFLFIWAFGEGPKSRQNYCKAMLIVQAISIGISIIFSFIWLGLISNIISGFADDYYRWSYDGNTPGYYSEYPIEDGQDTSVYINDGEYLYEEAV